jgi:hypothetical protein
VKLFVSSLISGYEAERDVVGHVGEVLRWGVLRAESFGARPDTPQHACLEAVRRADLVVLLLGARYGAIQASGLSATHEEWREAVRCHKPVLVFVESVSEREPEQAAFIDEVQSWIGGRFRESFGSVDELRDKVTRALADLTTLGPADEREMLERAVECVPDPKRGYVGGGARLVVVVAGGPRQQVLRPAEIEDQTLAADLQRDAMFGADAPLDRMAATGTRIESNALRIFQEHAEVVVHQDGTIIFVVPATSRDERGRHGSIPCVMEEVLRDRIGSASRFAFAVLERIDPDNRLTDAVPVVALRDAAYLAWRTEADASANPGTAPMSIGSTDSGPVMLSPAMVRRAALFHDSARIAADLTLLLRRQHR